MTDLTWLWIPFTLVGALGQVARNAMQRGLTKPLGTLGATHIRFLFGFPFAVVFLGSVLVATGDHIGWPAPGFYPWLLAGSAAQIAGTALMLACGALALPLLAFVFRRREGWRADVLLGGLVTGALVVAGWYVTGHLGHLVEHPDTLEEAFLGTNSNRAESLTFVAPLAYTLDLLTMWSDTSRVLTFGIASALGVIVGAAVDAIGRHTFRLESVRDSGDLVRHIVGGLLMGFGGVTALGCTIGQGISGVSTLALGSMLTTAAIIIGAVVTMKLQYRLMSAAA